MRQLRPTASRVAAAAAGCAVACALVASSAMAQAVTQQVVVSVGGSVVDNPYLEANDEGATVAATAEIRPRLSYDTSVTRFDLEAFAQGRAHADKYGFEDNYGASVGVRHRASEQLALTANAAIISTAALQGDRLFSAGDPGEPPLFPEEPTGDVTVLGQRGRTTSVTAGAGIAYSIDSRNQVAFDGTYRAVSLTYAGAADYTTAGAQGRFTHVVDERTSIGLIAGYRRYEYESGPYGDANTFSLLGSVTRQLDETWRITAAAGVEQIRNEETATVPEFKSTSFTANANLCKSGEREQLCLTYSRASLPTAFSGVRKSDFLGLSYGLQVSEYDSVSLGGSYSRSSGFGSGSLAVPATSFAGVRAGFDHRFNQRLSGYIEASIDKARRDDLSIDPRARVGAGIRYVFGRVR